MKWHLNSELLVSIIIYSAFLGITIPYGFPIFTPLVCGVLILCIIARKDIYLKINVFFISFATIVIMYLWGLYLGKPASTNLYASELANVFSYLMVWIIISPWANQNYNKMFTYLRVTLIINGALFSVLGIVKYIMWGQGKYFSFLYSFEKYPQGTSLIVDYNMFSLSMLTTIILSLFSIRKDNNFIYSIYLLLTMFSCSLAIVFSGSRRGWVILMFIIVFVILYFIKISISSKTFKTKSFLLIFIMFCGSLLMFLFTKVFNESILLGNSTYIQGLFQRLLGLFNSDIDDGGLDSRNVRWDYAFELFTSSDLKDKIFGQGFYYLQNYADYFFNIIDSDYPHNFLLSAILYSGVIGSLGIIIFLFVVFKDVYKGFKLNKEWTIIFSMSFLFAFISGNTIFSHKVFFVLILVLTGNSVSNKSKSNY